MTPFHCEWLKNSLRIACYDRSHRYFGDYHRVRVEVRLSLCGPDCTGTVVKVHTLERMGVAGVAVQEVRDQLVADFRRHAGAYLERPDYPARLLATGKAQGRPFPGTHVR